MRENTKESWGLAIAIVVGAIALRWLLWDVAPGRPYFLYYTAVAMIAFYCGWREATIAVILTTTMAVLWAHDTNTAPSVLAVVTITYVMTCAVFVFFINDLRTKKADLEVQAGIVAHTNREMVHRVKNILTVANAIVGKTLKDGYDATRCAEIISGRFVALGAVYDLLPEPNGGADLHLMMDRLVYPLTPDGARYHVTGDRVRIPGHIATTLGLVLHELGTNALKHGAWHSSEGKVNVGWFADNNELWFQWCERCGDAQCKNLLPTFKEGTGMKLISRSLPDAKVTTEVSHDGLRCTIVLPLKV